MKFICERLHGEGTASWGQRETIDSKLMPRPWTRDRAALIYADRSVGEAYGTYLTVRVKTRDAPYWETFEIRCGWFFVGSGK